MGRLVAAAIRQQRPTASLRLLSRTPAALGAVADAYTEHAACDFEADCSRHFAGIDSLLLISTNGDPERRRGQHLNAIASAVRAGVSRIIYTSFTGAHAGSSVALARVHAETEAALRASGVAYVILRNAQYAQMLNGYILGSLGANCLILPSAEAMVTYVPRGNVALVAAGALLGSGHDGHTYEITGSHALSGIDLAALIGEARGTVLRVIDADPWEYLEATMVPFGAPRFVLRAAEEMWAAARQGAYSHVTSEAERLAIGPLVKLPDYVRKIARAGVVA